MTLIVMFTLLLIVILLLVILLLTLRQQERRERERLAAGTLEAIQALSASSLETVMALSKTLLNGNRDLTSQLFQLMERMTTPPVIEPPVLLPTELPLPTTIDGFEQPTPEELEDLPVEIREMAEWWDTSSEETPEQRQEASW